LGKGLPSAMTLPGIAIILVAMFVVQSGSDLSRNPAAT
jgi:hypothetical protein